MAGILKEMSREVHVLTLSRPKPGEPEENYAARVEKICRDEAGKADVVWLAVPPGNQEILTRAALAAGKHVVAEKPWMCSRAVTDDLGRAASKEGLQIGVHYEYCFLSGLGRLSMPPNGSGPPVRFSGTFISSKTSGAPPLYNLGCHLLAIKCALFPDAATGDITVSYKGIDERKLEVVRGTDRRTLDFLGNREPLIQRFIAAFEASLSGKNAFPFGLPLSNEINAELAAIERTTAAKSQKAP